jgi:hypothetical protein
MSSGYYDADRLRTQRDIIRDKLLTASRSGNWLTLGELQLFTGFGEASISAQLRHLRKPEAGGFEITKRRRKSAGQMIWWEYRIELDQTGGEAA